jgi:D-alanyl-D-alanine carboxypeptidase (penicillin-binding protein 5/6)
MAFWVVFSVVLVALVLSLITMTVLLFTVEADGDAFSNKTKNESVNKDDKNGDSSISQNGGAEQNGTTVIKPPATVQSRSNYIANNSPNVTTIDGISSEAAIIVNMDSYAAIGTKNADTRIYPASMTKVMTLLVACENLDNLYARITVTQEQVDYKNRLGASGENFSAGETLTAKDLMYLIIYDSNSIACQAIAEYICGSEAEFVKLMNKKAKDIGLNSTNFVNSTGLHDENHYTTVREMAAIMAYALDNPTAKTIISSNTGYKVTVYSQDGKSVTRSLTMYTDWLTRFKQGKYSKVEDAILSTSTVKGGKTGYEDIPTACFVTYAEGKNGVKYICVVVGRIDDSGSTVSAAMSTSDTKKIYNTYIK